MAGQKRLSYSVGSLALLAAVAGIIFILNFMARGAFTRVDLTEGKQYTLSDSTREILAGLDEVVTIKGVFSSNIPSPWNQYTGEVQDLLREYQTYGKGKIQLEFIDPAGRLEEQTKLQSLGINPVNLPVRGIDQASTIKIYASIYVQYLDESEIIPYAFTTETLEYELSTTISRMTSGKKAKLGLINVEPQRRIKEEFGSLSKTLEKEFEIELVTLENGEPAPDDIGVLLVFNPYRLSDRHLFEIDQHIMRGGKAVFLTEGARVFLQPGQFGTPFPVYAMAMNQQMDSLGKLLVHYGVKRSFDLVQDEPSAPYPLLGPLGTKYPLFPAIDMRAENQEEHPITQGLDHLVFTWASSLDLSNVPENVKALRLVKTSPKSWTQAGNQLMVDPMRDPMPPLPIPGMGEEERTLAVLLSGKFSSYFEGREVPTPESGDTAETEPAPEPAGRLDQSPETHILVVGCSSFVSDATPLDSGYMSENQNFILSAVEWMAGGDKLSDIKKRKVEARPIKDPDTLDLVIAGFVGPLGAVIAVIAFGAVRLAVKRNRKKRFLESVKP